MLLLNGYRPSDIFSATKMGETEKVGNNANKDILTWEVESASNFLVICININCRIVYNKF